MFTWHYWSKNEYQLDLFVIIERHDRRIVILLSLKEKLSQTIRPDVFSCQTFVAIYLHLFFSYGNRLPSINSLCKREKERRWEVNIHTSLKRVIMHVSYHLLKPTARIALLLRTVVFRRPCQTCYENLKPWVMKKIWYCTPSQIKWIVEWDKDRMQLHLYKLLKIV